MFDESNRPRRGEQTFAELRRAAEQAERAALKAHVEAMQAEARRRTGEVAAFAERCTDWLGLGLDRPTRHVDDVVGLQAPPPLPTPPALWKRLLGIDGQYKAALAEQQTLLAAHASALGSERTAADAVRAAYEDGDSVAIARWMQLCLAAEPSFHSATYDSNAVAVDYDPGSRLLTVDYDVPSFESVPTASSYRYNKQVDAIVPTLRSPAARRNLYLDLIARVALRALHALFVDDDAGHVDTVVLNAYIDTFEPTTGNPVRMCVLSVRTTRSQFSSLALERADPVACLRGLSAVMSRAPDELIPVMPISTIDTVDRRFVDSADVLSQLDHRPNLMDLSPSEFEALITNLFGTIGLETRLTQPSRDGGVDCVAFDMRPILGGKVVIQAKRYAGTVGVSAVRDLYGTVLNEGASKGILVTTSGYGPAAYEFAANKPIELISGGNLLALLAEWAGVEARIEIQPAAMRT